MSIPRTAEQLAARARARTKLIEVVTYMDELWRSPVPLTQAEVNVLQEARELLLSEFRAAPFLVKTNTYYYEADDA